MANRSENTYTKINTVFFRDINNCIMPFHGFVMKELEWLRTCKFDCEEKIDGTNIRIEVTRVMNPNADLTVTLNWDVDYKGKTDAAQLPKKLEAFLRETYTKEKVLNALGLIDGMTADDPLAAEKKWAVNKDGINVFDMAKIPMRYTLYGEGYGAGIQSVGGKYRKDNAYIGFDVKVDDMYLLRESRDEIFNKLNCPIVPFIGQFTIDEAIEFVKKGFKSKIAEEDLLAEGLVCRSPLGLLTRRGERIIFKVKTCDWQKYFNMYHTYDPVEQIPNPKAKKD